MTPEEIYRKQIDSLIHDLIESQQSRGRNCQHWTLSAPFLPCPHPDCFGPSEKLFIDHVETVPVFSFETGPELPQETHQSCWKRVWLPLFETWGWSPLFGWPLEGKSK